MDKVQGVPGPPSGNSNVEAIEDAYSAPNEEDKDNVDADGDIEMGIREPDLDGGDDMADTLRLGWDHH